LTPSRKALREATAGAHDRVDAAFGRFDVTDRAGYAAFLRAHADVVSPLEAALPGEQVTSDWDARKRGEMLKEDLAFLRETSPSQASATAENEVWPAVDWSLPAIAGALYVLEGSRLGGRFIARQLPSGFPRAYLDGDQRAEKWQQLLSRIDEILNNPSALKTATAAALDIFAAFERSALRRMEG
jgi:heme oxygenase (biliverdin-IX-beta and delta-forming)